MRRNKLITAIAAGLCAGAISIASAGAASATEDDYLYDLQTNGHIAGPTQELLDLGHQACTEHEQGISAEASIDAIYHATNLSSRRDAQFLYESALIYLC